MLSYLQHLLLTVGYITLIRFNTRCYATKWFDKDFKHICCR